MNAVERMMKEYLGKPKKRFRTCNNGLGFYARCTDDCKKCEDAVYMSDYPPFTAEKQLELIKLIGCSEDGAGGIGIYKIDGVYFCTSNWYWQIDKDSTRHIDFEEALALLVIDLKDKLDNAKVKEILQR